MLSRTRCRMGIDRPPGFLLRGRSEMMIDIPWWAVSQVVVGLLRGCLG